jgi:membrane peptidoglycan carboxypeptidase
MSPFIREAIVAIEDNRFYEHAGVDAQGIIRALSSNLTKGTRQGASTLTQQYVTNVLNESRLSEGRPEDVVLSGQKTMGDKLREVKLALELEKRFSKDQILEGYLNIVFFNRNAYGIEAASRYFFSTSAKDLTLPQAALLAGLVNGPSIYDPTVAPEGALNRRNLVLDRMLEQGKITAVDHGVAVAAPIELNITPSLQGCAGASIATYFCDYVSHLILNDERYGSTLNERERLLYRGGLTITTTLGQQAPGRRAGPGGCLRRGQPGQVGSRHDHRSAGLRQDLGDGPKHRLCAPGREVRYPAELQRGRQG